MGTILLTLFAALFLGALIGTALLLVGMIVLVFSMGYFLAASVVGMSGMPSIAVYPLTLVFAALIGGIMEVAVGTRRIS